MAEFFSVKRIILISFAILAFAHGAIVQHLDSITSIRQLDRICILVGIILVFLWYRKDANERAYKRSVWLNVSIVAVAIIALPYYFFRTRGVVRGLIATALFAGGLILFELLGVAGAYAIYYGWQRT